jgi:hypothetical protein
MILIFFIFLIFRQLTASSCLEQFEDGSEQEQSILKLTTTTTSSKQHPRKNANHPKVSYGRPVVFMGCAAEVWKNLSTTELKLNEPPTYMSNSNNTFV